MKPSSRWGSVLFSFRVQNSVQNNELQLNGNKMEIMLTNGNKMDRIRKRGNYMVAKCAEVKP